MVENLAESPGMCSDGLGSAPIEIPKEGVFSWEREQERDERRRLWSGWRRKESSASFTARDLGPTTTRDLGPTRATRADSPRLTRERSARSADGPTPQRGRSVIASRTSSTAPSANDPRGRSLKRWWTVRQVPRTVRPTAAGSPTNLFKFSLIYSKIKIWICIFWDHCSSIMKKTCHMMQCNYYARKICEKQASKELEN
jgi:hypothetical protein